jgi:prevent-host-death family protein
MKAVGIRELKNRLSEYLRYVRAGEAVFVTDRGEVIAEILPPGSVRTGEGIHPGLVELARHGRAKLPTKPPGPSLYEPMPRALKNYTVEQLLDQDRGDR